MKKAIVIILLASIMIITGCGTPGDPLDPITTSGLLVEGDAVVEGDSLVEGDLTVAGLIQGDRMAADIEGYSVDVVQASDLNIALNDTLVLGFLFEPSIIVIDYSSRCAHSTTYEQGHTAGHSLITRTAVDTITCNTNCTALFNNAGAVGGTAVQNHTTKIIVAYGGYDGATDSYFYASGAWVSATHTLTLTFDIVSNTHTIFNYVEIIATAYR